MEPPETSDRKQKEISMTPEQRQEIIRQLERGEELSPEWARVLFPPEKREYELPPASSQCNTGYWLAGQCSSCSCL